jgi:hypothetical protein
MEPVTDKGDKKPTTDEMESIEEEVDVEKSRFGSFTQAGTFVGTGDYHPDPVRILVENLANDVTALREEQSELSEEVAAIREELGKIGRLVVGLHEILVRMDEAE